MGKLGDHFPPEQKQGYIDRHLVAGQVLYLFCHFTEPPKEKYLVLVCAGTEPLLFVVNSSVPPFVRRARKLLAWVREGHADRAVEDERWEPPEAQ